MRRSRGLFSAAIMDSGDCSASPSAFADALADRFIAATNCTAPSPAEALACLKEKPVSEAGPIGNPHGYQAG